MLVLLSPAKSLDYESKLATRKKSEPRMLEQAAELVEVMAQKSPDEIGSMMSISSDLAELNFERFQNWERPFDRKNARPAVLAFNGDVYLGMDAANTFDERDFTQSQKVIRILSGLYGVLRPLDMMAPYRLEMGSKVSTDHGDTLYDFWGSSITEQLNADLAESPGSDSVINLASNEYFSSVKTSELDGRLVTPTFLDANDKGDYRVVSFFAKRARGTMAGWIVKNRTKSPRALRDFDGMGYRFDSERSTTDAPVFIR